MAKSHNFIIALCALSTLAACATSPSATEGSTRFGELQLSAGELAEATNQPAILDDFDANDEVSWQVYVPDAELRDTAPGVVVFISPSDRPGFPTQWTEVLNEKNLMMMAPIDAGNQQFTSKRIALAVAGLLYMTQRYELDRSRFYLSGFSGGARVSGLSMALYPSVFSGAIYFGGAEMWPAETPDEAKESLRSRRFVFVTGANDFNRDMTRRVWGLYGKNGIEQTKLEDLRHHGHELPNTSVFERAITFLDDESL